MYHRTPYNVVAHKYRGVPLTSTPARVFRNRSIGGMYRLHKIFFPVHTFRRNKSSVITKVVEPESLPKNTNDPKFKKFEESIGQTGKGKGDLNSEPAHLQPESTSFEEQSVQVSQVNLGMLRDTDDDESIIVADSLDSEAIKGGGDDNSTTEADPKRKNTAGEEAKRRKFSNERYFVL